MRRALPLVLGMVAMGAALAGLGGSPGFAQPTPPIMPKIEEPALQPNVEMPPPATWPAEVPNRPLTAQEAADIALQLQPALAQAQARILNAQGVEQQARLAFPLAAGT